jgi:hypothetical protein
MPIDHLVDLRRRSRTLVEDQYLGLLEGYPVVIRAMQTYGRNGHANPPFHRTVKSSWS